MVKSAFQPIAFVTKYIAPKGLKCSLHTHTVISGHVSNSILGGMV